MGRDGTMGHALTLRPYQAEAVDAFFAEACRRQLMVLPTGSGKTILFGAIAKRWWGTSDQTRPILILAHRSELLDQAEQKLAMVWPEAVVGRVQGSRNEQLGNVLVASTQTLVLGRAIRPPGLIIYDECHHSRAEGAVGVLERLGVFAEDGPTLLGVTATPTRVDKHALGDIFERVTYEQTILQMILSGYLSDVRGKKVKIPGLNLSAIRTTAGDYNAKDLAGALNDQAAINAVVEAVQEHAGGRKSLVFAVDIAHARTLAERFRQAGVAAAAVDGTMSETERASVLRDFAENRLQTVVNCQILTEGYDQPDVDCVVIARPTRSQALYTQMVGRALRLHPQKKDALVLDLTDASEDKSLQTFTRLMKTQTKQTDTLSTVSGLEQAEMPEDTSVTAWVMDALQAEQEKTVAMEKVVESIHLFANRSRYRWMRIEMKGHEVFAIEYLEHRWAYLVRDGDAFWPVLELKNKKYMPIHDRAMPLDYAEGVAESILDLLDTRYVEKEAEWRKLPMTPKQREALAKYRIASDDTWTRGDAADALGERFAKRHVKDMLERLDLAAWQAAFQKPQVQAWLQAKLASFRAYGEQRTPSVVREGGTDGNE
ncbi:DEAD/DEAH box helicase [Alicyclobacillus sp. SP_1]|uniref:DEAD/DEAH box helicase n=1 Tax=Alicyclobacillus sp. SP_1 TaxID=2942475 RepID=UPI0021583EE8|nr:DEAD/DEAH box helicase [Alicyclobacillus sp. SP_1]